MNLTEFIKSSKSESPHYVLLGHPVEHSWSPVMHNTALTYYNMEAHYYAIDLLNSELSDLATYLHNENFKGANITIPYKQLLFDYLDDLKPEAQKIGAVNTIIKENGYLNGANTDYYGFLEPLKDFSYEFEGLSAVVFGTGGASRAIVVALTHLGIKRIYMVSRSPGRQNSFNEIGQVQVVSYSNWTSFLDEVALVVNATPLGMHPHSDTSPVREQEKQFLCGRICYDIVYNPIRTKFLKQAAEAGAKTINGLEMFIQQGSKSFERWTGKPFPVEKIRNTLHEKLKN